MYSVRTCRALRESGRHLQFNLSERFNHHE